MKEPQIARTPTFHHELAPMDGAVMGNTAGGEVVRMVLRCTPDGADSTFSLQPS
jgi:DNA integrity scanning protein DisA with diadenylate cyclase activity